MAESKSNSERLFSLTAALLVTEIGLTKREILQKVTAYGPVSTAVELDSAYRMFDRDKVALRNAGVEIETLDDGTGNNQNTRYRIPNGVFEWPSDVHFTAREMSLLNIAARAWAGASLSESATQAFMRLRVLGEKPESIDRLALVPALSGDSKHLESLQEAIEKHTEVSFVYRKEGEQRQTRTLEPWRLDNVYGNWMVTGFSVPDNGVRRFLLKRIVSSAVKLTGSTFEAPSDSQLTDAAEELKQYEATQVAEVRINPGSSAWIHFRMDEPGASQDGVLRQTFLDAALFADELRQFGTDVTILKPKELREVYEKGIHRLMEDHHG